MNKKILAFVCDGDKFLALRSNPDEKHCEDQWFTVTGSVEQGETFEDAVIREIFEETSLKVNSILDLNWGSIYNWQNQDHEEKNFIAFVEQNKINLNEEHVDFEWLRLDEFIDRLNWGLDKGELKKVLEKAIQKEVYFGIPKLDDFRKK